MTAPPPAVGDQVGQQALKEKEQSEEERTKGTLWQIVVMHVACFSPVVEQFCERCF